MHGCPYDPLLLIIPLPPSPPLPRPLSFGYMDAPGDPLLLDPTWKEEAALAGGLTVLVTAARELCAVHKPGGAALPPRCRPYAR